MAMSINKSWSAIILFTFLLTGSLCPAAPLPQEFPPEFPIPEDQDEERLRALERLRDRLNQSRQMQEQAAQQEQPDEPEPAPPSPSQSQVSLQPANGKMRLIFNNHDLVAFIRQISELLNLSPMVIDPGIQGSVTINTVEPMSTDEVDALFRLILKTKNVTIIEQNGVYQVVPISSALKTGVDLIEHPAPGTGDAPESPGVPRISTHVIPVEFIPVQDLIKPIEYLVNEGGVIGSYDRLNLLILTDYSDNIERILRIVHLLDSRYMDPDLIELIKIEHNASADVVADLQKMFGSGENTSTGISFVSLDRMNAIFVIASSKRGLEEVKRWIARTSHPYSDWPQRVPLGIPYPPARS